MTDTQPDQRPTANADTDRRVRIRALNDQFRQGGSQYGTVLMTSGIIALGEIAMMAIVIAVREFDAFSPENDPHGEHDFGAFELNGERIFWKIDYYDRSMAFASPDPTDPEVTARVMTIMLAGEY